MMSKINLQRGKLTVENRKSREKKTDMLRSIGKQYLCLLSPNLCLAVPNSFSITMSYNYTSLQVEISLFHFPIYTKLQCSNAVILHGKNIQLKKLICDTEHLPGNVAFLNRHQRSVSRKMHRCCRRSTDHPALLATFPLGPFLCLHLLLGTLYLQTFVPLTPYPPLNATENPISSSLLLPSSHHVRAPQIRSHDFGGYINLSVCMYVCLQSFDTVGWAAGRASG